jgi:hypothetical protein
LRLQASHEFWVWGLILCCVWGRTSPKSLCLLFTFLSFLLREI